MATLIDIAQRRTERQAGHPSIEVLQTFAAGRLESQELLAVSSHLLAGCQRCRHLLRDSFGFSQAGAAAYRVQAPVDLIDRIRALAEISPAQLRLALTNLREPSATVKAAATWEARSQIDDPKARAHLLLAGAEYLLDSLESDSRAGCVGHEEALLLGRLAFDSNPATDETRSSERAVAIVERSWRLVGTSSQFVLPRALLLSAYAFHERGARSGAVPEWRDPPATDALSALIEAQRLFALEPSTVEHALSSFALAGLVLESSHSEQADLLTELGGSLIEQERLLRESGEHALARVAMEYRLAIVIHARQWRGALDLAERLIRSYEDQGDVPAALRLQMEAARAHRELGDRRSALAKMRMARDGLLING